MKKVIFSIFFFSLMVVGVQAQKSTCSKSSCTAKPAAAMSSSCGDHNSASAASATESNAAAAKLASMDPTIEARTCPVSGTVSYVRKEKGATAGQYTYVDLAYDAKTNSFVNVSPVKMEGAAGCGAKGTSGNGAGCCAGKATNTSSSANKSCCAGKGKTASATPNKD